MRAAKALGSTSPLSTSRDSSAITRKPGSEGRSEALHVDIDDQRGQQNQSANENLEKAVDADVVETVIEDSKHQQADDRIADAPLSAEQACASDNHGRDRIQKIGVELLLLRAAKIRDAQH